MQGGHEIKTLLFLLRLSMLMTRNLGLERPLFMSYVDRSTDATVADIVVT